MDMPTLEEIDRVMSWAIEYQYDTRRMGSSYEQGVIAALEWILGITSYPPDTED